jgi:hypothetical protein
MARPWRAHVDFACPSCGRLLVECSEHLESGDSCLGCGASTKLVGIGTANVGNARWYRCMSCGQLHMRRRGEFVKTGERAGTEQFGSFSQLP